MRNPACILTSFILLASCDCYQQVSGVITDKATNKPIEDVVVENKNKTWSNTKTDKNGFFELSNVSGGISCPPMTILIKHQDYDSVETEIEAGGQKNIMLVKKSIQQSNSLTYKQAIENIRVIFEDYKTNEEGIESEDNKTIMTESLNNLHVVTDKNDLELLINIWNYYDPTDYSCRSEIYKILLNNKPVSINAVQERIKNRMSWESPDLSGTDFKYLLERLKNEK